MGFDGSRQHNVEREKVHFNDLTLFFVFLLHWHHRRSVLFLSSTRCVFFVNKYVQIQKSAWKKKPKSLFAQSFSFRNGFTMGLCFAIKDLFFWAFFLSSMGLYFFFFHPECENCVNSSSLFCPFVHAYIHFIHKLWCQWWSTRAMGSAIYFRIQYDDNHP